MIYPAPLRGTGITNIRRKKENDVVVLTGAEHNARDDSFISHFYGMLDLELQIGGRPATQEKKHHLHEHFSFNAHAQHLVGLGEGQRLPEDEDINTP